MKDTGNLLIKFLGLKQTDDEAELQELENELAELMVEKGRVPFLLSCYLLSRKYRTNLNLTEVNFVSKTDNRIAVRFQWQVSHVQNRA